MSKDKLTKEELGKWLDKVFIYVPEHLFDMKPLQQLREMIENYEEVQAFAMEIIEEKQSVEKDRKPATCQHCGGELVYAEGRGCFGCSKCKRLYWVGAEK